MVDVSEEGQPQKQVHVRHEAEGMRGELHGQLARRLRHDDGAAGWCALSLQEITDEVEIAATFLDVGGDDRNAVIPEHMRNAAITGGRLPNPYQRVERIWLGIEQALDRDPRGCVKIRAPFG
jgi:hypothetical protein